MTWPRVASDFRTRFNNPSPLVSGGLSCPPYSDAWLPARHRESCETPAARPPVGADLTANGWGTGRVLFTALRQIIGAADQGAGVIA